MRPVTFGEASPKGLSGPTSHPQQPAGSDIERLSPQRGEPSIPQPAFGGVSSSGEKVPLAKMNLCLRLQMFPRPIPLVCAELPSTKATIPWSLEPWLPSPSISFFSQSLLCNAKAANDPDAGTPTHPPGQLPHNVRRKQSKSRPSIAHCQTNAPPMH